MRTTYVVLVLTMLSAASSYGFDIGISGGIRDWEDTAQRSVRPTPTLILSLGEYFRPDLPYRFDAVGGIWRRGKFIARLDSDNCR
ncbi:MAG: hypothetical protein IPP40_09390 [bacterium]|nr:hypothetical protein [bacterium]